MLMTGIARLGADAVVRYTADSKPLVDLSLAFNYGKKTAEGGRPTQWINATLWGERAERVAPYLEKGKQLFVVLSDIHVESFEKRDGSGVTSVLKARIDNLELISERADKPVAETPRKSRLADLDDRPPF